MKARSFCVRIFVCLALGSLFTISVISQSGDLTTDLQSSFRRVDVVRINGGGELRSEGTGRKLTIQTEGRAFELNVEPNDILSSRYRAEDRTMVGEMPVYRPELKTYKGTIAGSSDSEVRLTIDGLRVEGFFEDSTGRRFIEPAIKYSQHAEPGDSVVYRAEDSLKDNTFLCEADIPGKLEFGRELVESRVAENLSTIRVLELATEADTEWVNILGGPAAANNEIISILNMVEGTYNNEVSLSIRVVYQHTWSASDPYVAADMTGILAAFVNYWNANYTGVARDAAHLFSGKSAAQGRGLAYLGVVCRAPVFAYGASGRVSWTPGKYLVPAHEIAHNLGADHADAAQNCANSLMNPMLTTTTPLAFCAFSRDSITGYVAANNSCLSEVSTTTTGAAPFDFDGDRRSDISVFRPSNGSWYLNRSSSGFASFQFGISGDKPVAADYDGDGRADAAVFRGGLWYRWRSATNTVDAISFGLPTDIPSPADFDGDGKSDVAVYRPGTGTWFMLYSSNGSFSSTRFGIAGDVPVAGDYDGDGKDDINLFRPLNGSWYRLNSSNGSFFAVNFGLNGDKPVAADFDGDGRADLAVWRPSNRAWYSIRSSNGAFSALVFGLSEDVPSPADYDGDGKTDISVFRPSNGTWYRLISSNGSFAAVAFGLSSDQPVPSYYIQ